MKRTALGLPVLVATCSAVLALASGTYLGIPDVVWTAESNQTGAHIGEAVARAGDVNGDGYDDLIVGSREYDDTTSNDGIAWVFYGGPSGPPPVPSVVLHCPQPETNGFFGEEVGHAGDVNGDGYDDVYVSMTNFNGSFPDEGAVFVYHGGAAGLDPTPDWTARGDSLYAHFGWGAGAAGDVNGDGYDDLIAGAYRYDNTPTTIHHAYVFHGSATGLDANGSRPIGLPGNADWSAVGDQNQDAFGVPVGGAGDVNGDGYDDVFVGAPNWDHTYSDEGAVFVWHGSAAGLGAPGSPANADWYVHSGQAEARMGGSSNICDIAAAGDLNGDGYGDLIVGTRLYDEGATNNGMAGVWYGAATGLGGIGGVLVDAPWIAVGALEGDTLGGQVASAKDFNGDGFDDVLIGVFGHDLVPGTNTNEGMVLMWFGGENGLGTDGLQYESDVMIEGDQGGAYFGLTLAGVGDLDADGLDDIVIGACYYDHGQDDEGVLFAFRGEPIAFNDDFETGNFERWTLVGP